MSDIVERLNSAIAMAQEPIGYGGTNSEDSYPKFDDTALSYVPLLTDAKATITALREEVGRLSKSELDAYSADAPNGLNAYADECHAANMKWWRDINTGAPIERNKGELLCLIHSEISEAMEGERKGLMDDKLPHRKMAEVELVDALIRIFDYAGAFGYDLQGAYREKMAFNATRADHQHEARARAGGKKW